MYGLRDYVWLFICIADEKLGVWQVFLFYYWYIWSYSPKKSKKYQKGLAFSTHIYKNEPSRLRILWINRM
jgi:hypothetical protein